MKVLISVIIPAFNCEKTIIDTINSIKCQSFKKYEIIVINDGSTDDTRSIVEKLSEENTKIKLYSQKNSGVSAARNKGILKSTGKYLTFLDADDEFESNFLENMYNAIIESDGDIACCGYYVKKNGVKKKQYSKFDSDNILYHYIVGNNQFHTSTWLIKKSYIKKENLHFDENMSWGEDFKFFCQALARTSNVTIVNKYMTIYKDDYSTNRLSSFNFSKLQEDVYLINSLKNDQVLNRDTKITDALVNFRLPALLTYKLLYALKNGEDKKNVEMYYKKYRDIIKNYSLKYGMRSLKLAFSINKLNNYFK